MGGIGTGGLRRIVVLRGGSCGANTRLEHGCGKIKG
ncbi:hypothetical protein AcdelDRAFT_4206 [Acidovorax delafieldii 2AN]|uniref:Uncharacterized protein n=1 Tax=Acidovorax delafieldii 2AN TaxID=573060 RepID=C5TBC6_ACIDE|nr:hypothetical protein AcdelDRAFT_4206 [Acidovorax delafieldii 2AN]